RERRNAGVARRRMEVVRAGAARERPGKRVLPASGSDYEHPHALIVGGLKSGRSAQEPSVYEPGLDRHDWESELRSLEDSVRADPIGALPELDALIARMLEETGVDENDEAHREYAAAHDLTRLAESGQETPPGYG